MSKKPMICPVCEEGHLHEDHFAGDFKHGDKLVHVDDLECYRCNTCGADPVMEDQIRRNHLKVADAKRRMDGLLSGAEIKATRELLHLSQNEAAELFGGGANAFSKYERGDVLQSKPMDRLLRLTARYPVLLNALREECGMKAVAEDEHEGRCRVTLR
ncbi:MAG: type II toxin-antitoxin system MqsA family antitoxin [Gammaproteobacteria bacterium]|nr:type II toxin-antitoxin system MqsA family antitoxin [Gammaproteobacteria bacterium]